MLIVLQVKQRVQAVLDRWRGSAGMSGGFSPLDYTGLESPSLRVFMPAWSKHGIAVMESQPGCSSSSLTDRQGMQEEEFFSSTEVSGIHLASAEHLELV